MSVPVELPDLAAAIEKYGPSAYFLTTRDDGRPHVGHLPVRWDGNDLVVDLGRGAAHNIVERPASVLLWPPVEAGGFSLIVDVMATADGNVARLVPERAVLHRPAPNGGTGHDCSPV